MKFITYNEPAGSLVQTAARFVSAQRRKALALLLSAGVAGAFAPRAEAEGAAKYQLTPEEAAALVQIGKNLPEGIAVQTANCAISAAALRTAVVQHPDEAAALTRAAIKTWPSCACELVTAAIRGLVAMPDGKQIIGTSDGKQSVGGNPRGIGAIIAALSPVPSPAPGAVAPAELVTRIVSAAISAAPDLAVEITECALEAAPDLSNRLLPPPQGVLVPPEQPPKPTS